MNKQIIIDLIQKEIDSELLQGNDECERLAERLSRGHMLEYKFYEGYLTKTFYMIAKLKLLIRRIEADGSGWDKEVNHEQ